MATVQDAVVRRPEARTGRGRSPAHAAWLRLVASPVARAGFAIVGVFVLIACSLWLPRFGGRASAAAALVASVAAYLLGEHAFAWRYPYLISMGAAATAYFAVAFIAPSERPSAVRA